MAMPLDIPWVHAFWADQPGFTAPANDAALPSAPDDLGTAGGSWTINGTPTWNTDFDGSGKPAVNCVGLNGLTKTISTIQTPRTMVAVARAKGTSDADIFDSNTPDRSLLDTSGGDWRLFIGSTGGLGGVLGAADTDGHLFRVVVGSGSGAGNEDDEFYVDTSSIGIVDAGNSGFGTVAQIGYSTNGDGNVDGTEIAFFGVIERDLTAQEVTDLEAWHAIAYQQASEPPQVTGAVNTMNSITLSWAAVPGVTGYRVWVDDVEDTATGLITGTSYTASGLTTGQMYSFVFRSENAVYGLGPASEAWQERAAPILYSVQSDGYADPHTPGVSTPAWTDAPVVAFNDWAAFTDNGRTDPNHFYWYEAGTTTPLYVYADQWLDGATISLRSGDRCLVIEWHRGDDEWRQTDLTTFGQSMTVDYSDTTTNTGSGGVSGPFDNTLLEHLNPTEPPFSVWMWPNTEPAASNPLPLRVGTQQADAAYVGTQAVAKMYQGGTQIWP